MELLALEPTFRGSVLIFNPIASPALCPLLLPICLTPALQLGQTKSVYPSLRSQEEGGHSR